MIKSLSMSQLGMEYWQFFFELQCHVIVWHDKAIN